MLHLAFPQIGISDFALQEYRKYKVKGKPEGKELKRLELALSCHAQNMGQVGTMLLHFDVFSQPSSELSTFAGMIAMPNGR